MYGSRKEQEAMSFKRPPWDHSFISNHREMSAWLLASDSPLEGRRERKCISLLLPVPCISLAEAHLAGSEAPFIYGVQLPMPFAPTWEARSHASGAMSEPSPEVAGGTWPQLVGISWKNPKVLPGIYQPWWRLSQSRWLRVRHSVRTREAEDMLGDWSDSQALSEFEAFWTRYSPPTLRALAYRRVLQGTFLSLYLKLKWIFIPTPILFPELPSWGFCTDFFLPLASHEGFLFVREESQMLYPWILPALFFLKERLA